MLYHRRYGGKELPFQALPTVVMNVSSISVRPSRRIPFETTFSENQIRVRERAAGTVADTLRHLPLLSRLASSISGKKRNPARVCYAIAYW